jgi:hypothetical protein
MQVTVTNIKSGKVSNGLSFRYGVAMFISAIVPPDGPQDTATTVTIFGQGFVAPVSVTITGVTGVTSWDVLSVAGTEIVAKTKPLPENPRTCGNFTAQVTVTNLDSGLKTEPAGQFTYQAVHPLITSVQIDSGTNTVQQYVPVAVPPSVAVCSTPWSSHRVTIRGSGFQQGMTVNFGPGPVVATFVDANTLTLAQLPDLSSIGLNQIGCTTGAGACGGRFVATQVSVTVNHPRNGCSDTLNGAIVINPCDTSCLVTGLTSMTFGAVPATNPTVGSTFSINLAFTPTPLTGAVTVDLTYVGFTATPATVTIPPSASPYQVFVTATSPGSGNIIASVGGGSCTVTAASALIEVEATMDMTIVGTGDVAALPLPSVGTSPCASGTCNWTFNQSPVRLTATPGGAGAFTGWSGATCGCTGTTSPCNVTMNQNRVCTATFTP